PRVDGSQPRDVEPEGVEGRLELEATPTDEARCLAHQLDRLVGRGAPGRLAGEAVGHLYVAGGDHRLRGFPALGETTPDALDAEAEEFARDFASMVSNIERVLRGKTQVIRLALACLAAEGHLLIEDVPGIGKTSLAKAIAESIDGTWTRIQFTPDLLPTD